VEGAQLVLEIRSKGTRPTTRSTSTAGSAYAR
jgi:hypothetical protein